MADDKKLTDSDKKVYKAIIDYINKYQYPPSVRDLCKLTGFTSTATIHRRLKALVEEGYIEFDNCARGIRIKRELIEDAR